jgi:NADPH-dependent F420 reductase
MPSERILLTLGIIGGTGKEGQGLGYRWARSGYPVIIGSRSEDKALSAAAGLNARLGEGVVRGMENTAAVGACDIAVLTVPYSAHRDTLQGLKQVLAGKVLIDVTNPAVPPKLSEVNLPAAGSAAVEAQQILGEAVEVVSAFQNISHELLLEDQDATCDVLVSGDTKAAKEQVLQLVEALGLSGWDAGPLKNAVVAESLTSVLIGINRRYKLKGAGIRIVGERAEAKEP